MRLDLPRRQGLRMSLTPLIDVVFLLLLFFMLSSTFLDFRALSVSAVSSNRGAATSDRPALVVALEKDAISINGVPVAEGALLFKLNEAADADTSRAVFVRPAPSVPLQQLVDIMEQIKSGGFDRISVQE